MVIEIKKGFNECIEKDIREGIENVKFEQHKIIAKSLKIFGMDLEFISKNIGLSYRRSIEIIQHLTINH